MCHLGDVAVHNRINEDNRPEEINFLWKDVFKKQWGEIKTPRLEISLTKESVSASAASAGMTNEPQLCAMMLRRTSLAKSNQFLSLYVSIAPVILCLGTTLLTPFQRTLIAKICRNEWHR